ncbi:zinc carboxypeptidase A 1-like [Anastrepha ludens]|uniref:zinc carboxypeptidase A 1-like n=1 Tax=Anastrepha ludens TaxID=28586 RepID=UPI0023B08F20|nr:zinc carboxypeptidase A 1-like [Anastrepha ludens]
MWQQLILIVLIGLATTIQHGNAERVRYNNYQVYQLQPQTAAQLETIKALDGSSDSLRFVDLEYNVDTKIYILIAPHSVTDFVATIKESDISYELVDENAQNSLDAEELVADANRPSGEYTWTEYHELDDTYAWLRSLAEKYPEQVSVFVVGQSYEGREILGVKISYASNVDCATKRGIFIEGGSHGREWISSATPTYIINQLLTSTNADVRKMAESFDWYVVPHANPDGFVYTHTTDRIWRKTRTPYANDCFGADPNRNFDFHWNEAGASNNSCGEMYAGPRAFSEVETRALAEYISTLRGKLILYLTFHSYSQQLLFPYGHTSELPPNYKDLKRVFDVGVAALSKRYGTNYTGGSIYEGVNPVGGDSNDWAYGVMKIPYSYAFKMRPLLSEDWIGFRLPAEQIIPASEEVMDSMLVMIKEIRTLSML